MEPIILPCQWWFQIHEDFSSYYTRRQWQLADGSILSYWQTDLNRSICTKDYITKSRKIHWAFFKICWEETAIWSSDHFSFFLFFFEMRTYIDHLISDFKPRPCIHVEGILCTYPTTHLLICICMWLYFSLLICPKKFMNWSAQLDLVNNQSLCYKVDENTNNTVEMQTL